MVQYASVFCLEANFGKMLTSGPVILMHLLFQGSTKWTDVKSARNNIIRLLNRKPVALDFMAWYILVLRRNEKNDRNGPSAFTFMDILNLWACLTRDYVLTGG